MPLLEREVHGAEREPDGDEQLPAAMREAGVGEGQVREPRKGAFQEVERRHREDDPEDRLDPDHPRAPFGQAHRERAHQPERQSEAERECEERRGAERRALGFADPEQDAGEHGAGAGRGDETAHRADEERAAVADAAELGELVVEARRENEVESAEHRSGEREKDDGHQREDPRIGERCAEQAARCSRRRRRAA